ncbi:MAG: branched-chain amino acid ABC transporter permease [Syntrophorhabdales bacterium]|jgi:branched-chain amino acid transport system permease protein
MDLTSILQVLSIGLTVGALYALIALGLNLIYGTMRLLNIAHGELIMIGAYITYSLFTRLGLSPLISIFVVMVISLIMGLLICAMIFMPIIKKSKSPSGVEANSLLIFFGLSIILTNLACLIWSADIKGYSYMTKMVSVGGVTLMYNKVAVLGIALVVCIGCYLLLQKTLLGKAVRALIQDKEAARLVGINTNTIYYFSFGMAFAMAGLAGALLSMFYEITPFIGMSYTIVAFIVIVLGGLGNLFGSLLGGFLLGLLEAIGVSVTSPGYRPLLTYAIFVLVILLRPEGIFTKRKRV